MESPAGIEPATPSLPSMRGLFTTPRGTSRAYTIAQVRSAVGGRVVGWGEVARGAVSGNFWHAERRSTAAADIGQHQSGERSPVIADGRTAQFRAKRAGVLFLDVSLVYHPDWRSSTRWRARAEPCACGRERQTPRPTSLPSHPFTPRTWGWLKGPTLYFLPGALGNANLPPLSPSFDPMELLPQVTSGEGARSPQRAWPQEQSRLGSWNDKVRSRSIGLIVPVCVELTALPE
jgi:hypothetical protein